MMDLRKIGKWICVFGFMVLSSAVWGQAALNDGFLSVADRLIPIQQQDNPVLTIRQSAPFYIESAKQFPTSSAHIIHLPSTSPHAFFCRMELLIEKSSKVPIVFRLGDVDQVNRMEGKTKPWVK